jgi:spore germination cell wall hydrolase CwlJ-like protein
MLRQAIALAMILCVSFAESASFLDEDLLSGSRSVSHKTQKTVKKRHKRKKTVRPKSMAPKSSLACMARNIYFEAGIESQKGKIAVANVTMNRVKSKYYPKSVCGVVFQKGRKACAFSWTCDRKSNVPPNNSAYKESEQIARLALSGALKDVTGNSDHYHATYVSPKWHKTMEQMAKIGRHVFYRKFDS